jgi:RhtB (resistance to homoserine/threonine) family protein
MTAKLLLVIGVTTLAMLSPGPDMILVMRNTLTTGQRGGVLTALGVLTGNLIHIAYGTLGIALLLSRNPLAFTVLRIASALYLVYLGVQSLRAGHSGQAAPDVSTGRRTATPYWQGLVNNVLNPKGILFYLGVFSQVITRDMSFAQTAFLVTVMVGVSTVFWIIFIQTLHLPMIRAWFERSTLTINRVFGCVLILLGARVGMLT